MGSTPSKVAPVRSRSGLSFVSTSSISSLDTIDSEENTLAEGVRNLAFDDVTTKSFQVRWNPPRNFNTVSYQLRIFPPDHIKSRTLLRAHQGLHHTFTRLQSSTEYTVAVIAIDGAGKKSPCETATTSTLPRPPRDLEFSNNSGPDSVEVLWKHCKGRPGQYEIMVTEEGEEKPTAQARDVTVTSKIFKGLMPGTSYKVTVRNAVRGMNSEAIEGKWLTTPRYVRDITFSDVTSNEMTLKWKKPEGKVNSYTLHLSEKIKKPKEPIVIERLKKTTYTFNGLIPGRVYMCKIVSNAGSKSSKPQHFTQCTVPLEVAGITARDVRPEEALVKWTPGFGDADDYDLFLTPTDGVIGETAPRGITKRKYTFTGLVPGTVYTIGIVANSKDKTSKRVVSSFATVPGMVGDLEASDMERSCTTQQIKWPPAAGRVDSYIITIRREDKSDDGKTIEDVVKPHYLLTDLTPGTLYVVHVAAMRDGRESSSVNKLFGTVPSSVPSITFHKQECSWDKISFSWEPAVGGVEKYRIVCKSAVGTSIETLVSSDEATHIFTNLHPATLYEITMIVVSNEMESAPLQRKQITGPDKVNNFHATSTSKREIKASWEPPAKGADEYFVKLSLLEEESMDLNLEDWNLSECEHSFSNLLPGSQYEVQVTPLASMVRGNPSVQQVYTKPGDIINVHIPEENVTTDSITVNWWGVEGNSKNVDVILSRLKKNDDLVNTQESFVVKQEHVVSKENEPSQVIFTNLEPDTLYGIRMRGVGKGGVGKEFVYTHATLSRSTPLFDINATMSQQSSLPEKKTLEENLIHETPSQQQPLQANSHSEDSVLVEKKLAENNANVANDEVSNKPAEVNDADAQPKVEEKVAQPDQEISSTDEVLRSERLPAELIKQAPVQEPSLKTETEFKETANATKYSTPEGDTTPPPRIQAGANAFIENNSQDACDSNSTSSRERDASAFQERSTTKEQKKSDDDTKAADDKLEENVLPENVSPTRPSPSSDSLGNNIASAEATNSATRESLPDVTSADKKSSTSAQNENHSNEANEKDAPNFVQKPSHAALESPTASQTEATVETPLQVPNEVKDDTLAHQDIKPILVIPGTEEERDENGQVSPKPTESDQLPGGPSSNISTPRVEKKQRLSFLEAITSSD